MTKHPALVTGRRFDHLLEFDEAVTMVHHHLITKHHSVLLLRVVVVCHQTNCSCRAVILFEHPSWLVEHYLVRYTTWRHGLFELSPQTQLPAIVLRTAIRRRWSPMCHALPGTYHQRHVLNIRASSLELRLVVIWAKKGRSWTKISSSLCVPWTAREQSGLLKFWSNG